MNMPGFTAERSLSRATNSYVSGRFARFEFSGKQVSAAVLVCVDGDCSFFGDGGGGRGDCLTPQEASDCRRNCFRNCRTLPPQQRSGCFDDCGDVCSPVC
jgi:hypothetical protein